MSQSQLKLAVILCAVTATPAVADDKAKKKTSYTRWALPAAGESVSGDPELILTFDDGPHERYSAVVLDELKKRNLKAIFFWVSHRITKKSRHRDQRRALVERAVREGHIVASHTNKHFHLCHLGKKRAAAEIDDSATIYRELTGLPMTPLFRAPYGDHCPRLLALLAERNLTHIHWDIDPMEWTDNDYKRVSGTLRRKFAKVARKNRRAVVLMHDTRLASAKALPIALDWVEAENQRRLAKGQAPIRFLSGSDLIAERMDRELVGWVNGTAAQAAQQLGSALASLVP
jgi:peptidoglycan/xylan/chitin deacetylase (PgdA/CDA1 family)